LKRYLTAVIAGYMLLFGGSAAGAQTFFGTLGLESAVGVERGSTALVEDVEHRRFFFTLDTFGSEDVGTVVSSFTVAQPRILGAHDQLDVSGVVAGPGQDPTTELRATGVGYRVRPGAGDTTFYFNARYASVTPDGPLTGSLSIEGDQRQVAFGARRQTRAREHVVTTMVIEARARQSAARSFGTRFLDETTKSVFLGIRRSAGRPFGPQSRLGFAVSAGLAEYGASMPPGVLASAPGADESFLRYSASAEGSLPVSSRLAINAGIVGQWTDDSLPVSQRCGFGTNSYSRGFDLSELSADRCLGGRIELAANARPGGELGVNWLQAFAGLDGGRLRNLGNDLVASSSGVWSSGSVGLRALGADWITEISATKVFRAPSQAITRDDDARFWVRAAIRF